MAGKFDGKIAVVTGAASGIGLASSKALLEAGATVVMIDRDNDAVTNARAAYGDRAIPLVLDLLDEIQCPQILDRILEKVDHIDIFHANAGSYVGGDFLDVTAADIDRVIGLNVGVVMKNVRSILPHLIERKTGDIVVTGSVAGYFPVSAEPVYTASKWAINCFVQTLRRQVIKYGIRVGEVAPGPVATGLLKDWPAERLAKVKAAGGLIEPEDVAESIMFMLTRHRNVTVRDIVVLPTSFDM